LRQEGLGLPALRVSRSLHWASAAHVLHVAIEVSVWCQHLLGMLVAVPLGLIDYMITRRWAVHVDPCGPVTVREAVFYLTSYREQLEARHGSSSFRDAIRTGYRPSRQEIELRVRLIVAASLEVPLERAGRTHQNFCSFAAPAMIAARKSRSKAAALRLRAMLSFAGFCLSRLNASLRISPKFAAP